MTELRSQTYTADPERSRTGRFKPAAHGSTSSPGPVVSTSTWVLPATHGLHGNNGAATDGGPYWQR
jgi:hypothetical protein